MQHHPITFSPGAASLQFSHCLGFEAWPLLTDAAMEKWANDVNIALSEKYRAGFIEGVAQGPEFWTNTGWKQVSGVWKVERTSPQIFVNVAGGTSSITSSNILFTRNVYANQVGAFLECLTHADDINYYSILSGWNAPRGSSVRVVGDYIDQDNYKFAEAWRNANGIPAGYILRLGERIAGIEYIRASMVKPQPLHYTQVPSAFGVGTGGTAWRFGICIKPDAFYAIYQIGSSGNLRGYMGYPSTSTSVRHGLAVGPDSNPNAADINATAGARFRFGQYRMLVEHDHSALDALGNATPIYASRGWYYPPSGTVADIITFGVTTFSATRVFPRHKYSLHNNICHAMVHAGTVMPSVQFSSSRVAYPKYPAYFGDYRTDNFAITPTTIEFFGDGDADGFSILGYWDQDVNGNSVLGTKFCGFLTVNATGKLVFFRGSRTSRAGEISSEGSPWWEIEEYVEVDDPILWGSLNNLLGVTSSHDFV